MKHYSWRIKFGTLFSQSINALVLGGHPDMSLSTRAYFERDSSPFWGRVYRTAEGLFGAGHCYDSFESDLEMALYMLEQK